MKEKVLLFLHGFASSAHSIKAQYLRGRFTVLPEVEFHAFDFNPTPHDFEHMTVTGMINRLRQFVLDHNLETVSIIASSLGAVVGLNYAHRFRGVAKMLFLAPVLCYHSGGLNEEELRQWREKGVGPVFHAAFNKEVSLRYAFEEDGRYYLAPVPPACPIMIIHGRHDEIIPADNSRRYAVAYPGTAQYIEVDSAHHLNDHLEFIWGQVENFLLS
jgi:pimeloyl-ACP methyl ester carboxylesterase